MIEPTSTGTLIDQILHDHIADGKAKVRNGELHDTFVARFPKGMGLDNYLLRFLGKGDAFLSVDEISARLRGNSALVTPDMAFVGPKVSQALLCLQGDCDHPIIEIVPKHAGDTLKDFLKRVQRKQPDAAMQVMHALMKSVIEKPDMLRRVFDEAAFTAYHAHRGMLTNRHSENVMVHYTKRNGYSFSHIDFVPQEESEYFCASPDDMPPNYHYVDKAPSPDTGQAQAKASALQVVNELCALLKFTHYRERYLEAHRGGWLHEALQGDTTYTTYCEAIDEAHAQVVQLLSDQNPESFMQYMQDAYPHWQGFRKFTNARDILSDTKEPPPVEPTVSRHADKEGMRARQVSVVPLTESPATLKLALDRISAAMLPSAFAKA